MSLVALQAAKEEISRTQTLLSDPGQELSKPAAPDYPLGLPFDLRTCSKLYLDVGSNIGVQVRKLYEPHKYPMTPAARKHLYGSKLTVHQFFNQEFGAPEQTGQYCSVCSS